MANSELASSLDATRRTVALVLAGLPASYALRIDLARTVPWAEWPFLPEGPVGVQITTASMSLAAAMSAIERTSQPY